MTAHTGMPAPLDLSERDRIVTALDETLFVQAAAGSGKTRSLVDRIVQLVVTGTAGLDEVAAITFTEKAAAELRDRVRRGLDDELARARGGGQEGGDPAVADRVVRALAEVDSAAIGTLHSFARRLLTEHPIEAGLPPRIDVLDEVASAVAFDDRWSRFVDRLLADPAIEHALLLATAGGVRLDHLRLVALGFEQNWDLAIDHAPAAAPEVAPWADELMALLDEADALVAEGEHCCDDDDKLLAQLGELATWARRVRDASDEFTRLSLLGTEAGRPRAKALGRRDMWPSFDLRAFKARYDALGPGLDELRQRVIDRAVRRLAVDLRRFTLESAAERRDAGELEFHDLLVLARQMLRDPAHGRDVRTTLHRRYRHLLIDEFQDTDPIQIELAVLIAGLPDDAPDDVGWDEVETSPGHLFFVGDPKQSIYRFRRADISLFLRAAERFGAGTGAVALTTNFRTGTALVDVVNSVFGELIHETRRDDMPSQPPYVPMVPVRPDAPVGPPVAVVGREVHGTRARAADLRRAEAADVAAAIERVVGEGWLVDRAPHGPAPRWEPARLGDVTILLPTRTSLPALEDALDSRGIPYRAESASLVYASRLVRDLLLTLRAVDDPTDEPAVVAALRSPLFACGDDDLYRYRRDRGSGFDHSRPLPDRAAPADAPDPVLDGLAYLHELHPQRRWLSPSEMVDRVVRDRRVLELGEADGRARDLWRRVRFVVDQARAWTDATNGTLRQYLAWVRQQTAEGSRVSEAVLPETDDDAVRIMTVHASKGLEFPVTIVSGMSTQPSVRRAGAEVVWPPGRDCIIRVSKVVTDAFDAWKPIDEQMSHDERIRLLYVACTRAQDHLVVSLHRRERAAEPPEQNCTNAELLVRALGDDLTRHADLGLRPDELPDDRRPHPDGDGDAPVEGAAIPVSAEPAPATGASPDAEPAPTTDAPDAEPAPTTDAADAEPALTTDAADAEPALTTDAAVAERPPLPPFDTWRRQRDEALSSSRRPRTVSATALTEDGRPDVLADPGLHKRPLDLDLPPWQKGRYGSAIGRAVHGVLQTADLAGGDDAALAAAVASQAAAEGLIGHEPRIRSLVDAALASPTVAEAVSARHWREVYVGVPLGGGRTLEGYVDLLFERGDGLVVADYKTGPSDPGDDLDPLVERYRTQGAAYALAVARATGRPVVDVVFVFLTPSGAVDRSLADLATAVTEVERLAAAGDDRLVET